MDKVESNRSSACSPCITMSVLEHTPIIEISALHIIGIVEGKVWELRMGLVADAKPFYISMNDHRIRRRNRMQSQPSKNAIYLLTFFYFVRNGMKSSSKPLNRSFSFDNPMRCILSSILVNSVLSFCIYAFLASHCFADS